MSYQDYAASRKKENAYISHNAGSTGSFRYPHLESISGDFFFDSARKYWGLSGTPAEMAETAKKAATEDITVWEFLSPKARKLHFFDMTGTPYDEEAKEQAFEELCKMYRNREIAFPAGKLQEKRLSDLKVREEFRYVRELYADLSQIPVYFLCLDSVPVFPFGSVLKGTNLVITDGRPENFGQDMLHALYHLREGIPGIAGDNLHVEEIWSDVPSLYALQLSEGRVSRRKRLNVSPHIIRFTDYIYLRAYLGQAFTDDSACSRFHPVFAVIEPSVRLMMHALRGKSGYDRNRILAAAILEDRTQELRSCFDHEFGRGSFADIYGTWSVFEKYERAAKYMDSSKLDGIMFEGPALLPTGCSAELIRAIWKDREKRHENIALLSSCK